MTMNWNTLSSDIGKVNTNLMLLASVTIHFDVKLPFKLSLLV